jgi:hypothetical protein
MLSFFLIILFRYRFQYDGRLQRSMETGKRFLRRAHFLFNVSMLAVMLMETFDRLSRKEKYVWDVSSTRILCSDF